MAGELTHIIPTHPSDPNYRASKTRGITWCDANGVAHTITAVYWSPTNNVNDRKLIWQLSNDVPYDNTCTATVVLSQNKTSWIVTIEKDGEDVTSSLSQMITWIYNGKGERVDPQYAYSNTIDLSQFPRGDYRLDLSRITSKAGGYFPGSGALSFPDHIYIGQLVAGDKLVAIEYVPTNDITVNSIEIYTTSNQGDSNYARVKILHESGLYIAAFNSDNGPDSAEIYNLSGYKRYVNNQSVVLKAGNKYYIVYQHDDTSPGENAYLPAYFDGENGNYKEYSNNRDTVTTTDITNFGDYIGEINTVGGIAGAAANQFFVWSGYDLTNVIKMNRLYIRNSSYHNTYGGEIGEQAAITPEVKDAVLSLDDDSLFIWTGWGDAVNNLVYNELHQRIGTTLARTKYKGIKTTLDDLLDDLNKDDYAVFKGSDSQLSNNTIYKKTQNIKIDAVLDFSQSSDSFANLVALIKESYNAAGNKNIATKGTIYHRNLTGYVMTLKSGYTYDFNTNDSGYAPSELTTSKVQTGCMYYMNTAGTPAAGSVYENPGILLWNGTSFEAVAYTTYDGSYINYFDYVTLADALTAVSFGDAISHIGSADLLVGNTSYYGDSVISNTIRSATAYNNRKYYLKINGKEV